MDFKGAKFAVLGTFFLLLGISLFAIGSQLPPNVRVGNELGTDPDMVNIVWFSGFFAVFASLVCWIAVFYKRRFPDW
jgi:hypothetical protein